jgi:hypothetical protein
MTDSPVARRGGNDGGARSLSREVSPHMFADHPDQVN